MLNRFILVISLTYVSLGTILNIKQLIFFPILIRLTWELGFVETRAIKSCICWSEPWSYIFLMLPYFGNFCSCTVQLIFCFQSFSSRGNPTQVKWWRWITEMRDLINCLIWWDSKLHHEHDSKVFALLEKTLIWTLLSNGY